MNNSIRALSLVCLLSAAAACTPFATYPQGDRPVPPHAAVNDPIPTLMAVSIEWSNRLYGTSDDPAINLPPGSSPDLYQRVIRRLHTGHPMLDPKEPAIHVMQVRSRGLRGDIDIFVPKADGTYAFATVTFFRDPFKGYVHEHTRWWETGDVPPGPNYGMPPAEQPAERQPVLAHD